MERIIINPENYKKEFLQNLDICFKGWGGEKRYDWVFERKVGKFSPEIGIIENDEDGAIAGTGYTYRVMKSNGSLTNFGIVSGSWTLPAARRKGCLTKMVETGRDQCKDKGLPFITAFMTDTNPSSRRLRSLGANMISAYHLFSPGIPFENISGSLPEELEQKEDLTKKVYDRMMVSQAETTFFYYSLEEFEKQYITRLNGTTILRLGEDFVILEKGVNEVKVILMTYANRRGFLENVKKVSNWCLKNRKLKAFFFTVDESLKEECLDLGFESILGYFTILATGINSEQWEKVDNFHINMADKM